MAQMSQNLPQDPKSLKGLNNPNGASNLQPLGNPNVLAQAGPYNPSMSLQGDENPVMDQAQAIRSSAMTQANPFNSFMQALANSPGKVDVKSLSGLDNGGSTLPASTGGGGSMGSPQQTMVDENGNPIPIANGPAQPTAPGMRLAPTIGSY